MKGLPFARMAACAAFSLAAGVAAAAPATTAAMAAPAAMEAPATPPKGASTKLPTTTAPVDLSGSWTGPVTEVGRPTPYTINITLVGKTGQTSYPDQNCTGSLTRVGISGDYGFFTETITRGKFDPATKAGCLDGSMILQRDASGVVMAWMTAYSGKAVVAYGSLVAKKK